MPVDGRAGRASTPADLPLQVHGQRLSPERLAAIGRNLLVDGLALADAPAAGQAAIALRDYDRRR